MDWTVPSSPTKSIFWSLNSQYDSILRWNLWEVIKFSWAHGGGAIIMGLVPLEEKMPETFLFPSLLCEDTEKRQLFAS